MWHSQTLFTFLVLNLISLNAFAVLPTKVIHLAQPAVIDGIPVKAGDIEVFVPNEELARGVLSQAHVVQTLPLSAETELFMKEPRKLEKVTLPKAPVNWLLHVPFRDSATLTFRYDGKWNRFEGVLVKSPSQIPGFPTGQINPAILENDTFARCDQYNGPGSSLNWSCRFSVTLAQALDQNFGSQKLRLPEKSTIGFTSWGMDTLKLHEDAVLLGLPVSHLKAIRINRWVAGGPFVIVGLTLSEDAEYDGLSLSQTGEVEFYEPNGSGFSRVSAFVPSKEVTLWAANQPVTIKALARAYLNRDRSIRYARLAMDQTIQGILFPKNALVFFGTSDTSAVSSIGLFKSTRITIDGITYINDMGEGTLFLDINASGKVYRVRKVNS
jgi:hypothetical protein